MAKITETKLDCHMKSVKSFFSRPTKFFKAFSLVSLKQTTNTVSINVENLRGSYDRTV